MQELTIEFDREVDGRHIASVPELPGCMVYGRTAAEAENKVQRLALDVLREEVEDTVTYPAVTFRRKTA